VITRRSVIVGSLSLFSAQRPAQAEDQPIVGSLFISRPGRSYVWERIVAHMQKLGYVDGATIRYVPRFTQDPAQLPSLASEIAALSHAPSTPMAMSQRELPPPNGPEFRLSP